MKRLTLCLLLAALPAGAWAQHDHPAAAPAAAAAKQQANDLADGEVKRVDKAAGKITLKHGEIANVHMGPMTMVFGVRPKALLDKVAAGDKVKFRVEEIKGDLVVTAIEKAR